MTILTQNALATMYGPAFLLLYFCVIVAVCVACAWAVGRLDTSRTDALPLVPTVPDPFEIAYLRGGENELVRVAIFDLIERGSLKVREEQRGLLKRTKVSRLAQTPSAPDASFLPPLLQVVFGYFRTPRTAQEVFKSELPAIVKTHCAAYARSLRDDRLLNDEMQQGEAARIGWLGATFLLGLGGYKLWAALVNGHDNVFFLILFALMAVVALAFVCQKRRLSRRGKAYLKRLQLAFAPLKGRPALKSLFPVGAPPMQDSAVTNGGDGVLLVSVFGVTALTNTPYSYYAQMFAQGSSSGGCGGGCGAGGCGGGGCGGGGCGGCGGGG